MNFNITVTGTLLLAFYAMTAVIALDTAVLLVTGQFAGIIVNPLILPSICGLAFGRKYVETKLQNQGQ